MLPRVLQAYRDEHYDKKILEEMGELGLLGATIQGYDCAGVSNVASGLITKAVERVDSGYRSGMSVQSSLVMGGIDEFGTQEQKDKFLPKMAKVPEANMFPDVEGLRGPFTCLNSARYGIAWGITGALEDCISRARTYALERKQFKGNPIAKYQLVQKKLADATTDAAFGTIACVQVGRLKDKGLAAPEMISMIKRQNCDRALYNARTLQEIFGGNAVSDEYGIGRHVANLFVTQTYEGQSDIHKMTFLRGIGD
ncbi:putative Glutaryl-CoA dehydrogenase, mitochondrial [Glarea lozoyensis 74030]|uniref:Putative Glutaryl-CoA dehydrogenase, mitochondrial n=1 Tax=Glarea lozoyensis (strain ATCC 74030 / MF5533) TaxID=1104152 RepID=H0ETX2_GLAL7|nr:putative Glutaryl-CoA dehydrogenase, mitochondrial [Glarea lozoyensis 74030]